MFLSRFGRAALAAAVLGPQGVVAVVAEGLAEVVRREYPSSSFVYEPSNPAGAVTLMAKGDQSFAVSTAAEFNMVRGDPSLSPRTPSAGVLRYPRVILGTRSASP